MLHFVNIFLNTIGRSGIFDYFLREMKSKVLILWKVVHRFDLLGPLTLWHWSWPSRICWKWAAVTLQIDRACGQKRWRDLFHRFYNPRYNGDYFLRGSHLDFHRGYKEDSKLRPASTLMTKKKFMFGSFVQNLTQTVFQFRWKTHFFCRPEVMRCINDLCWFNCFEPPTIPLQASF